VDERIVAWLPIGVPLLAVVLLASAYLILAIAV
jgi:hypothetical protein